MDIRIGYKTKNDDPKGLIIRIDENYGSIYFIDPKVGITDKTPVANIPDYKADSAVFLGIEGMEL